MSLISCPARLVLVRHGETVGNRQQLWAGWSETPLSSAGREQVRLTAKRLQSEPLAFTALYSSPIGRAWETALAIGRAIGLQPVAEPALKEMHFGQLEAISGDRFAQDYPEVYARWQQRTDESFGWPGGETRAGFRARVSHAVARLARRHAGETILVISHSGFIRMALAHLRPDRFAEWWHVQLDNCSLTHLVLEPDGQVQVPILNDVVHLVLCQPCFDGW